MTYAAAYSQYKVHQHIKTAMRKHAKFDPLGTGKATSEILGYVEDVANSPKKALDDFVQMAKNTFGVDPRDPNAKEKMWAVMEKRMGSIIAKKTAEETAKLGIVRDAKGNVDMEATKKNLLGDAGGMLGAAGGILGGLGKVFSGEFWQGIMTKLQSGDMMGVLKELGPMLLIGGGLLGGVGSMMGGSSIGGILSLLAVGGGLYMAYNNYKNPGAKSETTSQVSPEVKARAEAQKKVVDRADALQKQMAATKDPAQRAAMAKELAGIAPDRFELKLRNGLMGVTTDAGALKVMQAETPEAEQAALQELAKTRPQDVVYAPKTPRAPLSEGDVHIWKNPQWPGGKEVSNARATDKGIFAGPDAVPYADAQAAQAAAKAQVDAEEAKANGGKPEDKKAPAVPEAKPGSTPPAAPPAPPATPPAAPPAPGAPPTPETPAPKAPETPAPKAPETPAPKAPETPPAAPAAPPSAAPAAAPAAPPSAAPAAPPPAAPQTPAAPPAPKSDGGSLFPTDVKLPPKGQAESKRYGGADWVYPVRDGKAQPIHTADGDVYPPEGQAGAGAPTPTPTPTPIPTPQSQPSQFTPIGDYNAAARPGGVSDALPPAAAPRKIGDGIKGLPKVGDGMKPNMTAGL